MIFLLKIGDLVRIRHFFGRIEIIVSARRAILSEFRNPAAAGIPAGVHALEQVIVPFEVFCTGGESAQTNFFSNIHLSFIRIFFHSSILKEVILFLLLKQTSK